MAQCTNVNFPLLNHKLALISIYPEKRAKVISKALAVSHSKTHAQMEQHGTVVNLSRQNYPKKCTEVTMQPRTTS